MKMEQTDCSEMSAYDDDDDDDNNNIFIYLFIYSNWVVTRWQWLFYMYTKYEIGYY